jgi:heme/copper-type cytochrome/quinol oxidase subunit 1
MLSGDAVMQINVHDTYYVIGYLPLAILISLLFGIIGLGYWGMQKANRTCSKWLTATHLALTFGGPLLLWLLSQGYRTDSTEYIFNTHLGVILYMLVWVIVVGQLLFPINIIYALLKNKNKASG